MGTALLVFINAIVLVGFFLYFRRRIARALESETILDEVRNEVGRMIVELNETTDRNVALLEERVSRLSALLSDADKRIVVLKKEADQGREKERVYSQLGARAPAAEAQVRSAAPGASARSAPAEAVRPKSPREEVLDLHGQGVDAKTIAAKLGKTVGEVELIISLGDRHR